MNRGNLISVDGDGDPPLSYSPAAPIAVTGALRAL